MTVKKISSEEMLMVGGDAYREKSRLGSCSNNAC